MALFRRRPKRERDLQKLEKRAGPEAARMASEALNAAEQARAAFETASEERFAEWEALIDAELAALNDGPADVFAGLIRTSANASLLALSLFLSGRLAERTEKRLQPPHSDLTSALDGNLDAARRGLRVLTFAFINNFARQIWTKKAGSDLAIGFAAERLGGFERVEEQSIAWLDDDVVSEDLFSMLIMMNTYDAVLDTTLGPETIDAFLGDMGAEWARSLEMARQWIAERIGAE